MNLDIHGLRDLTVKGFGLYLLVCVVQMVPMTIVMVFQSQLRQDPAALGVTIAGAAAYAGLGYVCTFRTRAIVRLLWNDHQGPVSDAPASALAKLIAVFGVFFAIQSAGLVCSFAWDARHPDVFTVGNLTSSLAWFVVALWFIRRPEQVTEILRRRESASP